MQLTYTNMENNNGTKEKISVHERITRLEVKVDTILTNHLPHLQKSVYGLNTKFWAVILLLISNLVGLIVLLTQKL